MPPKKKKFRYVDNPWDKQDYESDQEYVYFQVFLGMGRNRRIKDLPRRIKVMLDKELKEATLRGMSAQNAWLDRARKYEIYLNNLILEDREGVIREMEMRHASGAKMFLQAIEDILTEMIDDTEHPLTANKKGYLLDALTRSYERVARLERLTYGEVTDKRSVEQDVKKNIKDLEEIMNNPKVASQLSALFEEIEIDDSRYKPNLKNSTKKEIAKKETRKIVKDPPKKSQVY